MTKSPVCHPCFHSVYNYESRKNIIILNFGYTFILYICKKIYIELNFVRTGTAENGGFQGGTSGKESICQCRRHSRPRLDSWVWKKEMETHPIILAWEVSWIEEPGGLQPMGSQRVGHDWVTNIFTSLHSHQGLFSEVWGFKIWRDTER